MTTTTIYFYCIEKTRIYKGGKKERKKESGMQRVRKAEGKEGNEK